MTVQEINRVHQRYIGLSNAFKAAWTFHQFLEGMRKVYPEDPFSTYEADFQDVYRRLKGISENLNDVGAGTAAEQLDSVEKELEELTESLRTADSEISPTRVRQFFERVRNYDDGILQQLVKFYLYAQPRDDDWEDDRLDKADFLLTRLSGELDADGTNHVLRDPAYIRDLTTGLWRIVMPSGTNDTQPAGVESQDDHRSTQALVESVRTEIDRIDSIEQMTMSGLVQRYRELKHGFGRILFHPRVAQAVVEANLALKNRVTVLYAREEQRIVAEYQQVFDLERDVPQDKTLRDELSEFRVAVERFEAELQGSNVRLDALADVQRRVRTLLPQLRAADDTGAFMTPPTEPTPPPSAELNPLSLLGEDLSYVADDYERLYEALSNTSLTSDPKKVTLDPEVFGFGLEPREVVAFRRLVNLEDDRKPLEVFLLGSAAMRYRIQECVDAIKGILDDTAATREGPEFSTARRILRVADRVSRRLSHLVEVAMMAGDVDEARERKVLEMRMTRTYAGLWLMIYRA